MRHKVFNFLRFLVCVLFCQLLSNMAWSNCAVSEIQRGHVQQFIPQTTIRVLVWNIQKAKSKHFLHEFQTIHSTSKYDFILLQEAVFDKKYSNPYLQMTPCSMSMVKNFKLPFSADHTGVATFSKFTPVESSCIKTKTKEPLVGTSKVSLFTQYKIAGMPGVNLLVVNVHAINFVSTAAYTREIKQIIEHLEKHRGPILLAGDFNTWRASRLSKFISLVKKAGLIEVKIPEEYRKASFNMVLDHVFVRGLHVDKIQDLSSKINSSDHEPLSFTLTFSQPARR
jgi:endonuclease/exonuclease/phosphatase (EEP) superfamily protein YafD